MGKARRTSNGEAEAAAPAPCDLCKPSPALHPSTIRHWLRDFRSAADFEAHLRAAYPKWDDPPVGEGYADFIRGWTGWWKQQHAFGRTGRAGLAILDRELASRQALNVRPEPESTPQPPKDTLFD